MTTEGDVTAFQLLLIELLDVDNSVRELAEVSFRANG
jgi:hypothetical protein